MFISPKKERLQVFNNIGATSKLYAPEDWIEATAIPKTLKY